MHLTSLTRRAGALCISGAIALLALAAASLYALHGAARHGMSSDEALEASLPLFQKLTPEGAQLSVSVYRLPGAYHDLWLVSCRGQSRRQVGYALWDAANGLLFRASGFDEPAKVGRTMDRVQAERSVNFWLNAYKQSGVPYHWRSLGVPTMSGETTYIEELASGSEHALVQVDARSGQLVQMMFTLQHGRRSQPV